jgi:hypothetical protein
MCGQARNGVHRELTGSIAADAIQTKYVDKSVVQFLPARA